jgi:hypothetical protein
MNNLFKTDVPIELRLYFAIVIFTKLFFPELSLYSFIALMISAYQFMLLFYSIGLILPVRYLAGSLMCVQMLVGPAFAYNGLDEYQLGFLKMQVDESTYFSYVIPATIMFLIGLRIKFNRNISDEFININQLKEYVKYNQQTMYTFIVIGFISSLVSPFFSAEIGFVFTLFGSFKFVGLFMIILGDNKLKPISLFVVLASIILSSLGQAMFHDLIIWMLFMGSVFSIKYKPSNYLKFGLAVFFIVMAIFIQMLKGDYREATWKEGKEGNISNFAATTKTKNDQNELFTLEKLKQSNIRINQGFIITNIMNNVPEKENYSNGKELMEILEAAILPRVIAPNKLNAGDRFFFMKWAGFPIAAGTSMGLSSIGDGYINFGQFGGMIFMFFLGLLFSFVISVFYKHSFEYPILYLLPTLVFYYPMRADCELQTILGHLFKSCFLIFIVLKVWKRHFVFKIATN